MTRIGRALGVPARRSRLASLRFLAASSASASGSTSVPFYGAPRPQATPTGENGDDDWKHRLALTVQNASTAFFDPTRADAVAAVGELTGTVALQQMLQAMKEHGTGKLILEERPVVTKETIPYKQLIADAANMDAAAVAADDITFGQAYGLFLSTHGFDPDERDAIKYIDDPELAYVMLRYRQCHDFWHTLTALPPTVPGELGLKWLELFQTSLPLAALSSTVGSLSLPYHQQHVVWGIYLPWAQRVSKSMPYCGLMNVYYEKEWDTPLVELRERLHLEPAPQNVEGH